VGEGNENNVNFTVFEGRGNENDVTVIIFYLVSNGRYFLNLNDAALV
jgi:hypothetical protein